MDDLEQVFEGLDRPRPLPASLRDTLSRAIGEAALAAPALAEPVLASTLPGPALPDGLASSLADALMDPVVSALDGLDAARPLPPHLRARLEGALSTRRRSPRWLAVAAAVVLIAGTATAVVRQGDSTRVRSSVSSGEALARPRTPNAAATPAGPGSVSADNSASGAAPSTSVDRASNSGAAGSSAAASPAPPRGPGQGPPPPFAFPVSEGAALPSAAMGPAPPPPPPTIARAPLTIAVIGGDRAEQSGFDAYISLLNQDGGINGHPVQTVTTSPSHPVANAVATVNLSRDQTVGIAGPVLETLAVPDGILRGSVFDAASAPAHQAVALVDAMFAPDRTGQVVAVYRGTSGIWATDVPDAMAAALRARGATPLLMTYTPGQPLSTPPATAALLALDTASAKAWFADAARAGYHPVVGGVESLAEPSLARVMPDGTRALAPYSLADSTELRAIGSAPGTAAVHGWVSAKVLAVALWRSQATTPAATVQALAGMTGYNDGFAPPLEFRPHTNSRVPDGTLYTVLHQAFTGGGTFVRDPA